MNTKHSPSIPEVERMLEELAPEVPVSFDNRIQNAPWRQGTKQSAGKPRLRLVYSAVIAATLLLVAGMLTPAGRTFASELLEYFIPGDTDTQPLPSDQIFSAAPTHAQEPEKPAVLVPADQVQPSALAEELMVTNSQGITLEKAAELAGFTPIQPAALPRDYELKRVTYLEDSQAVSLQYGPPNPSFEMITILESRQLKPVNVGASAKIEEIDLAGIKAEMVSGLWLAAAGASEQTWINMDYVNRIRWQQEGLDIEIYFMLNEPSSPTALTREEQLQTARSMVDTTLVSLPSAATNEVNKAYEHIAEIQKLVNYAILQPGLLPDGLPFSHARLLGNNLMLYYGPFAADKVRSVGDVLLITEENTTAALDEALNARIAKFPASATVRTMVNGTDAILYYGNMETEAGQSAPDAKWKDEGEIMLFFKNGDLLIGIHFDPWHRGGTRLLAEDLVKIAESLK